MGSHKVLHSTYVCCAPPLLLQAIVRTHTREKRELIDTIAALKRVIIRGGDLTEAQLDNEVRLWWLKRFVELRWSRQ